MEATSLQTLDNPHCVKIVHTLISFGGDRKAYQKPVWHLDRAMNTPSRTTVVTVTYNSAQTLPTMLASIAGSADLVVVDNGSVDASAQIAIDHRAKLIRLERNEGFGRACNAGAKGAATEFLFFVNPDARLSPNCVSLLEAAADDIEGLVGSNPLVVRADGSPDFKTRSILVPGSRSRRHDVPKSRTQLQILAGCALFCRRETFEAVGGFDPAVFLYHEDHDLAIRLAQAGGTLWHVPEAVVRHDAGTGSPRSAAVARLKGYHMARSRYYVMKKHRLPLPFLRTLLPALFGLVLPHNALSGRRRARYLGQFSGATSVLSDNGVYAP